jgi:hypothetical protein
VCVDARRWARWGKTNKWMAVPCSTQVPLESQECRRLQAHQALAVGGSDAANMHTSMAAAKSVGHGQWQWRHGTQQGSCRPVNVRPKIWAKLRLVPSAIPRRSQPREPVLAPKRSISGIMSCLRPYLSEACSGHGVMGGGGPNNSRSHLLELLLSSSRIPFLCDGPIDYLRAPHPLLHATGS